MRRIEIVLGVNRDGASTQNAIDFFTRQCVPFDSWDPETFWAQQLRRDAVGLIGNNQGFPLVAVSDGIHLLFACVGSRESQLYRALVKYQSPVDQTLRARSEGGVGDEVRS